MLGPVWLNQKLRRTLIALTEIVFFCFGSGHGLSGLALLSLASFVAVPAMFAGGISLAFARKLLF